MKLTSRKNDLTIYVQLSEKDFLEDFIFHSYLFKERMAFNFNIVSFDEEKEILLCDNFIFTSKLNSHLDKYIKYDQGNNLGFASSSFLFKDDENSLIYSGDIGSDNDLYLFNQKVDWFITETTHIRIESLTGIREKLNAGKLILTHIDDDLEEPLNLFYKSLQENIKSSIIIAFDGLEINQSNQNLL